MFDHVKFGVTNYETSKAFYLSALEPLGVCAGPEGPPHYGIEMYVPGQEASLCLFQCDEKPSRLHLAFAASTPQAVDAFYRAAIAAGGRDHGRPGYRDKYHAGYYAAYVLDPDGHNIEAVFHSREP
ncbi:VOC family protein [Pseudomarimonas salicorniae]|uniref:VOC family protein n=1 Tax=Pseudomarimonas salicorniae TaxID=2933270 RepID=A0ABT0GG34_9GAMM|nr:VOC family protein [Lysobacter sp. CAU 1642]MCK7593494.1 VOC family protein [Lysobacter sp. CAU 1642]